MSWAGPDAAVPLPAGGRPTGVEGTMVTTGTIVKADSVLAHTAREVLAAHAGGAGPRDGMTICPVCGYSLPCASGRAAAEVLLAAGLAQSSGLVGWARR